MIISDWNDNKIIIKGQHQIKTFFSSKYKIKGYGNTIIIEESVKINNGCFVVLGNRNYISIGKDSELNNFVMRTDGIKSKILIGNNVYLGGGCMHSMDSTKIQVGKECLFSHDIDIRNGDGHSIYYQNIKKRYNESKNIIIGNHVWIGIRVQILKGSIIADNCIIGASSVVNKAFEESNCIIVGYPAKIIKRGIEWNK